MFYYLYEIKNLINGKVYRGVHKTKKMDDGYMGSGAAICEAIKTDGLENFSKTILETFESSEEMYRREEELVDADFLARNDVYNKRRGGFGGFDYINKIGKNGSVEGRCRSGKKAQETRKQLNSHNPEYCKNIYAKTSTSLKTAIAKGLLNVCSDPEKRKISWQHSMSLEANKKRNETFKKINHQQGDKNSQYGLMWITNENESKRIKKNSLIPEGWKAGRKIKYVSLVQK